MWALTTSPVRVVTKGTGAGVGEPNKGQVDGQWSHLGGALELSLHRYADMKVQCTVRCDVMYTFPVHTVP